MNCQPHRCGDRLHEKCAHVSPPEKLRGLVLILLLACKATRGPRAVTRWALVQSARSDRLCWRLNWLRVGNGQAEERGGAVRGSPLRPRSHHPVRALVSSIQAEPARPGGDDAWIPSARPIGRRCGKRPDADLDVRP